MNIRDYENASSGNNGREFDKEVSTFIQDRERFIRTMVGKKSLIEKEFDSLQKGMNEKTERAFNKKCMAWSKLLNAIEVLEEMYNVRND